MCLCSFVAWCLGRYFEQDVENENWGWKGGVNGEVGRCKEVGEREGEEGKGSKWELRWWEVRVRESDCIWRKSYLRVNFLLISEWCFNCFIQVFVFNACYAVSLPIPVKQYAVLRFMWKKFQHVLCDSVRYFVSLFLFVIIFIVLLLTFRIFHVLPLFNVILFVNASCK